VYKYRNGLWPMQYVFLIRSSAGGKKYVTKRHEAEPSDVFLTAGARAYQKHVLHGPETVSIFVSHCCDVILLCIVSQISNKIVDTLAFVERCHS